MFCSNKEYKKKTWPKNNVSILPPIETHRMVSYIILNASSILCMTHERQIRIKHHFSCFVYRVPILKNYNWILMYRYQ